MNVRTVGAALAAPLLMVAGTLLVDSRPAARRAAWLRDISTDLANLADHPVRALVLSVLVADGDLVAWAVLGLAGLLALGARIGVPRALVVGCAVHVLATLVSEGAVAYRIHAGALPGSARVMTDVGPSYVVVAVLAAAAVHGGRAGRVTGVLGIAVLVPSTVEGLRDLDVAAVGHVTSLVLGPLLAWPWARHARRASPVAA